VIRTFIVREKRRAFAATVYVALVLVTFIPASVALALSPDWSFAVKTLSIAITAGSGALLIRAAIDSVFSATWAIFWMWVYVFLGLAQSYQLAANRFPWGATFSSETVVEAQLVIVFGCAVTLAVSNFALHKKTARAAATIYVQRPKSYPHTARVVSVALFAFLLVSVLFIVITGDSLFAGKAEFQNKLVQNGDIPGSGSLFFIATAGAITLPAVAIVVRRNGVRIPLILIVAATVVAGVVTNPLTGSRFLLGSFLIATLGAILVRHSILRLLPAGIAGGLITVFPSLDLARGDGTGSDAVVLSLPHQSLVSFDFDAIEMLFRSISVAGHIPANYPTPFELMLAPILRWLPVLSDQVQGVVSGRVVAELTGMGYSNVSMPLWGEANLMGGAFGVCVVFALLGVLFGLIRARTFVGSRLVGPTHLIVDLPVAALLIIILRGSLYEVLGYLIFAIAIAVAVWGASKLDARPLLRAGAEASIDSSRRPKTVAFYLPQFHPIAQNDKWWGKGFTEWVNVARALPQFDGHDHPRRPSELGAYDLRDVAVMHSQAELAREHDVDAFCFYFYWFDGQRLLETPLDNYVESGPDFPFCISWANENWSRRWDGKDQDMLIAQNYSPTTAMEAFDSFVPYLSDPRYLRLDGAAVIMVHRADHLPEDEPYAEIWRTRAAELGLGPIHLIAAETNPGITPASVGFDAVAEFPPVGSNTLGVAKRLPPRNLNPKFTGRIMSYPRLVRAFARRADPGFIRYRGVAPMWDNTARKQAAATIYVDSSPFHYRRWLSHARAYESELRGPDGLVFVNAWNEWAEGAYLEPDESSGRGFLEATRLSMQKRAEHTPAIPVGRPSIGWLRSLSLAAAGTALQAARRSRRTIKSLTTR